MSAPTDPPIQIAQNTPRARQHVAAQARMYSDAKLIHNLRIGAVFLFAFATIACAIGLPSARQYIGAISGLCILLLALVVSSGEKRQRMHAAAVQEEFDTDIFQLPWNAMACERPSPTAIAKAARRYDGGRDANWYPDTGSTLRPFDVLICQASNLGWGATMHRLWAYILQGALICMILVVIAVGWMLDLSFSDIAFALIVPVLAPVKELIDLIRANLENAGSKESAERKVGDLWKSGLSGTTIDISDCRAVQDRILAFRQVNAYVPDWLDSFRREDNESAMRASSQSLIEEARDRGYA